MGNPVEDFETFKKHYEKSDKEVFAFILHLDDVNSFYDVAKFLTSHGNFVDQLAKSAGIWTYYFYKPNMTSQTSTNPSGDLSRLFGLLPSQLPALVVFAKANHLKNCPSVVFHLDPLLFKPDMEKELDARFKELYGMISACQRAFEDPHDVIRCLDSKRRNWDNQDDNRSGLIYMRGQIEKSGIADFPSRLMDRIISLLERGLLNSWRGGGIDPMS